MFTMTAQQLVDKFTQDMNSGWLKPDDVVGFDYWTYDDVRSISEDFTGEIANDEVARAIWDGVAKRLARYDNVDNDVVRDMITSEIEGAE
jgi:hypothetical protein